MKRRCIAICLWLLILPATASSDVSTALPPNPVLVFMGTEEYESGGKWTRYFFAVYNRADYPNELFAAAPELPPCGSNGNSSRTWVDLYDQRGKRLYGFCAIRSQDGLARIWFNLRSDEIPPSWIYMEMTDRKTDTKYKSNLAETTM